VKIGPLDSEKQVLESRPLKILKIYSLIGKFAKRAKNTACGQELAAVLLFLPHP